MKRLFFILFLVVGITNTYANKADTGLRYNGLWLSTYDSIVIIEDSLQFVTISMDDENKRNSFDHWSISGDLKVNPDYTANSYSIQISSHGEGKGRLTYIYNQVGCGSTSVSIDIYKQFNPNESPYNIEISGPDCILEGDTVVYSIKPILTKNLTQGIGVDEYFWSFSSGLVNKKIYNAGDGSSVTFVAGNVTGNEYINVQVGLANDSTPVYKYLGKAAPKPVFLSSTCVPYGKASITFEVEQEDGVKYHWASSDNNWRFAPRTQSGNIVTVTPNENTSPFITITATYTNGDGCNGSSTSVEMHRTWGNSIILQKEGDVYNRCVADTTLFILDGQVAGSGVHWDLPKGWDFINEDTIGFSISITPINPDSVLLKDTIVAVSKDTCDRIYRKSSWIYVKPASVTGITDYGCLKTDTTYKFKITGLGHAPQAEYYKWIVGNDTTIGGDSLVWRTIAGTQEIKVIPRGEMYDETNYYWGDTATFALAFQPTPPDSIIPSDTCLFSQREIETTLRVQTPIPGQTYHWTPLPNWNMSYAHQNPNDSSIVSYITSGADKGNYQVSVWATGSGNTCPISTLENYTIKVDTITWTIGVDDAMMAYNYIFFYLKKDGNRQPMQNADWYIKGTHFKQGYTEDDTQTNRPTAVWYGTPDTVRATLNIKGECTEDIYWYARNSLNGMLIRSALNNKVNTRPQLLSLFPNPASQNITIGMADSQTYFLYIMDATGKLVLHTSINGTSSIVDISMLDDGIYNLIVSDGRSHDSKSLIIKH